LMNLTFCDLPRAVNNLRGNFVIRQHTTVNTLKSSGVVFGILILLICFQSKMLAQCNGQDAPECNCAVELQQVVNLTVCINQVDYPITLTVCNQFPNPNAIRNPCTNCTRPLDAITWVKKICLPPALLSVPLDIIYPAIVCATNLCTNHSLIGPIDFPQCEFNPSYPCNTLAPYCHALALPRCVKLVGLCYEVCNTQCSYCIIWRDYCYDYNAVPGTNPCWTCNAGHCTWPVNLPTCPEGCMVVPCHNWEGLNCCSQY
jgi:hypothetical protein